jgi:hypothetical protein
MKPSHRRIQIRGWEYRLRSGKPRDIPITVSAEVWGLVGLHRSIRDDRAQGYWALTHIPSGYCLARAPRRAVLRDLAITLATEHASALARVGKNPRPGAKRHQRLQRVIATYPGLMYPEAA